MLFTNEIHSKQPKIPEKILYSNPNLPVCCTLVFEMLPPACLTFSPIQVEALSPLPAFFFNFLLNSALSIKKKFKNCGQWRWLRLTENSSILSIFKLFSFIPLVVLNFLSFMSFSLPLFFFSILLFQITVLFYHNPFSRSISKIHFFIYNLLIDNLLLLQKWKKFFLLPPYFSSSSSPVP